MLEKTFKNEELRIELKSFIDYKQNIWFLGKDVAKILGFSDTDKAIRKHVDEEDKYKGPAKTALLVPGLGENQDTPEKRINSWKKGYMRGQPDLMILNYHKDYKGLCIEFKSPTNNYCVTESQLKMKEKYCDNEYAFILSNDYDKISKLIHKYMAGVRIPCEYLSLIHI